MIVLHKPLTIHGPCADDEALDAAARIITVISGPMACGGKVRAAAGPTAPRSSTRPAAPRPLRPFDPAAQPPAPPPYPSGLAPVREGPRMQSHCALALTHVLGRLLLDYVLCAR